MHEYRIPLDPTNPGQFFACCGLFELAELAAPGGLAAFEAAGAAFVLRTESALPPPSLALAPPGSLDGKPYDRKLEPLELEADGHCLVLNWWLTDALTKKSALKMHGARQETRAMFQELLGLLDYDVPVEVLFHACKYTTTRFGLDFRAAWDAQDLGYSPNDLQGRAKAAATFPWIEVLAVIGLQGFRPAERATRSRYRYSTWQQPLSLAPARAACAAPWTGLQSDQFEFQLGRRGQGFKTFLSAKGVNHV